MEIQCGLSELSEKRHLKLGGLIYSAISCRGLYLNYLKKHISNTGVHCVGSVRVNQYLKS